MLLLKMVVALHASHYENIKDVQTLSMEGHIASIFKICGPKLTQSRYKVTVSNVGDGVILPQI